MTEKRYPRNRGVREQQKRVRTVQKESASRVVQDPLFGDIPLIRIATPGTDGQVHEWWQYDPDYQPPLPRGAIRGDVRKQLFCSACHVPKYFYVDERRTCMQCAQPFIFRAAEQKYWYETLRFNFSSVPIRCVACRRQRRSGRAQREQIAVARSAVRAGPEDPAAHLSLARALVEYHERTGQGDLNDAVAAARRAAALWPEADEPMYWEGVAHALAGRNSKARTRLDAFVSRRAKYQGKLEQRARDYLKKL